LASGCLSARVQKPLADWLLAGRAKLASAQTVCGAADRAASQPACQQASGALPLASAAKGRRHSSGERPTMRPSGAAQHLHIVYIARLFTLSASAAGRPSPAQRPLWLAGKLVALVALAGKLAALASRREFAPAGPK